MAEEETSWSSPSDEDETKTTRRIKTLYQHDACYRKTYNYEALAQNLNRHGKNSSLASEQHLPSLLTVIQLFHHYGHNVRQLNKELLKRGMRLQDVTCYLPDQEKAENKADESSDSDFEIEFEDSKAFEAAYQRAKEQFIANQEQVYLSKTLVELKRQSIVIQVSIIYGKYLVEIVPLFSDLQPSYQNVKYLYLCDIHPITSEIIAEITRSHIDAKDNVEYQISVMLYTKKLFSLLSFWNCIPCTSQEHFANFEEVVLTGNEPFFMNINYYVKVRNIDIDAKSERWKERLRRRMKKRIQSWVYRNHIVRELDNNNVYLLNVAISKLDHREYVISFQLLDASSQESNDDGGEMTATVPITKFTTFLIQNCLAVSGYSFYVYEKVMDFFDKNPFMRCVFLKTSLPFEQLA